MSESDCPRNLTTIQCGENPVNRRSAQDFQMISTSKKTALSWLRESWRQKKSKCGNGHSCPFVERKPDLFCRCSKTARNSMGPSAWLENILESRLISAQPGRKTEIEKRSWFGGSLL
jgi:hypothetical protein